MAAGCCVGREPSSAAAAGCEPCAAAAAAAAGEARPYTASCRFFKSLEPYTKSCIPPSCMGVYVTHAMLDALVRRGLAERMTRVVDLEPHSGKTIIGMRSSEEDFADPRGVLLAIVEGNLPEGIGWDPEASGFETPILLGAAAEPWLCKSWAGVHYENETDVPKRFPLTVYKLCDGWHKALGQALAGRPFLCAGPDADDPCATVVYRSDASDHKRGTLTRGQRRDPSMLPLTAVYPHVMSAEVQVPWVMTMPATPVVTGFWRSPRTPGPLVDLAGEAFAGAHTSAARVGLLTALWAETTTGRPPQIVLGVTPMEGDMWEPVGGASADADAGAVPADADAGASADAGAGAPAPPRQVYRTRAWFQLPIGVTTVRVEGFDALWAEGLYLDARARRAIEEAAPRVLWDPATKVPCYLAHQWMLVHPRAPSVHAARIAYYPQQRPRMPF